MDTSAIQAWLAANPSASYVVAHLKDGTTKTVSRPAPAPVPAPKQTVFQVQPGSWYKDVGGNADLTLEDVCLTNGGIAHFVSSGNLVLRRVRSLGAPAGKGMYAVVVATGGAKSVLWDNTGLTNAWVTNGNEAALRVMGGCGTLTVINVDFVCRMHRKDDGGKGILAPIAIQSDGTLIQPDQSIYTWWKQVVQFRDFEHGEMHGGRIVGPWDVGESANALTPMMVKYLLLDGVGLTHEPHFTDPKTYGTVIRRNCYRIDEKGNPILDAHGNKVMWPDKTWRGK